MYRRLKYITCIKLFLLIIITLFISSAITLAINTQTTPLLLVTISEDEVSEINIIEKNDYYFNYYEDLFTVQEEQESYYNLKLYADTTVLIDASPFPESFIYTIPLTTTRIQITHIKSNKVLFDQKINLCNNNNICEYTTSYESSLTCNDCQQSNKDNYCEIIHDNICDPDCNNLEYECDPLLTPERDGLLDTVEFQCKQQFNGDLCRETEECLTTSLLIDSRICCGGLCSEKFLLKSELNQIKIGSKVPEQIYVGKQIKKAYGYDITKLWIAIVSIIIIITIVTFIFIKQQQHKKLFVEINQLINQYNYDQIKKILKKKGYDENTINKAINLHYTKYKSYYEKQFNQLEKNK